MKQTLKRILSISLVLILLCSLPPLSALAANPTSGKCGDNAYWEYDKSTKTLTISGTGELWAYGDEKDAGWDAYLRDWERNEPLVHKIVIEKGITKIGDSTFAQIWFYDISLPEGLLEIGNRAFWACSTLEEIILPQSLTKIGHSAFEWAGLKSIDVPANVKSIGDNAFALGLSPEEATLKEITLHEGLESIGEFAFHMCPISEIHLPNSVKSIGKGAFWGTELDSVTIPENMTVLPENLFWGCYLDRVVIHDGVTKIENGAFKDCDSLSEVHFTGSKEQWWDIEIEGNNEHLLSAHITFGAESGDDSDSPFRDVKETDWFYAPVIWAVENGITGGVAPNTFGPNDSCTRAQVVTFLWAAAGKPAPTSKNNPFKDVKSWDWYYNAVLWAVEQGITGGLTADTFGPNNTCTRAQIVTFLYAAEGKPYVSGTSTFSDVKDSDWFAKAVKWAAKYDVTGGIGNGMFGPNNTCTRGQVVTFLCKADQVDPNSYETSPLKAYIPAVEAALAENSAYYDHGSGFLFDIDNDGLEEMVLLWKTSNFNGNSYYPFGYVYSVYDIENSSLVTRVDKDLLVYDEESPYAYVQISEYQGRKVIVACRAGLSLYNSSRYEYTLYDTVTFEKIMTAETNYAGKSLIRAEFINNDDSDGSMRLYQLLAQLQQRCNITAEQPPQLTQSDAERITYNEWSDYLSNNSSLMIQEPSLIKNGVKYYCYSRQSNDDFDYYKVWGYLFINSVTGKTSIKLFE